MVQIPGKTLARKKSPLLLSKKRNQYFAYDIKHLDSNLAVRNPAQHSNAIGVHRKKEMGGEISLK